MRAAVVALALFVIACSADPGPEDPAPEVATTSEALTVGGCECASSGTCADLTYSDIPADGVYLFTTFGGPGGGGGATQPPQYNP